MPPKRRKITKIVKTENEPLKPNGSSSKTGNHSEPPSKVAFIDLPQDVLGRIVRNVGFADYINLICVSKAFLATFDTQQMYQSMWKGNFSQIIKAHEIPESDKKLMRWGWRDILERMNEIKAACFAAQDAANRKVYQVSYNHFNALSDARLEATNSMHMKFSGDKRYFLPLVLLYQELWEDFCAATEEKKLAYNVLPMCLVKTLLHLQNVRIAMKFFISANAMTNANIEKAYFELGRFDFGFSELCMERMEILDQARTRIRTKLPLKNGVLKFAAGTEFHEFIAEIGTHIVQLLPKPRQNCCRQRNILRRYVSVNESGSTGTYAIVAKLISEEILSHPLWIGKQTPTLPILVHTSHIKLGSADYCLSPDSSSLILTHEVPIRPILDYHGIVEFSRDRHSATRAIPKTGELPPTSESYSLWNTTVNSVTEMLQASLARDVSEFMGDVQFDTKMIRSIYSSTQASHTARGQNVHSGRIVKTNNMLGLLHPYHGTVSGKSLVFPFDDPDLEEVPDTVPYSVETAEEIQWLFKTRGFVCRAIMGSNFVDLGHGLTMLLDPNPYKTLHVKFMDR